MGRDQKSYSRCEGTDGIGTRTTSHPVDVAQLY